MAHHNEGLTVNREFVVELTEARLKVVDASVKSVKSVSVLSDLNSVPGNLLIVVLNALIVRSDLSSGVVDAVLEGANGLTEGFGTNEHVTSLGNLKLVSVLTEESTVGVESTNSLLEVRGSGVCGGGSCLTTVFGVRSIGVVVMTVDFLAVVLIVLFGGDGGVNSEGGSGQEGSGNESHRFYC